MRMLQNEMHRSVALTLSILPMHFVIAACGATPKSAAHVEELRLASPSVPERTAVVADSTPPDRIVQIGVGAARVCALRADGHALCATPSQKDGTPTELPFANIARLVLGESDTCAILEDGTARCLDGSLPELGELNDLTLGRDIDCAVTKIHTLRCWSPSDPSSSHLVELPDEVTQVDSKFSHVCAVTADGSVYCWGENSSGELGARGTDPSERPIQVASVRNIVQVSTGGSHTCARDRSGNVYCWGANYYNQVGDGTGGTGKPPTLVPNVIADSISAGAHHTCALTPNRQVVCWGWNWWTQMGGDRSDSRAPAPISDLPLALQVGAHGAVTCALLESHEIACLGGYSINHFGPWRFGPPGPYRHDDAK
jgi:Regulator of chromosome condensation (RCC1) repeat